MRGKLNLPRPPEELLPEAVARFGSRSLPITHCRSLALAQLPALHSDPFDRMLVAQARSENMVLMTANSLLQNYPVETLWCGK
jgi:PIN domain nuclease of toxin-antitoxin system